MSALVPGGVRPLSCPWPPSLAAAASPTPVAASAARLETAPMVFSVRPEMAALVQTSFLFPPHPAPSRAAEARDLITRILGANPRAVPPVTDLKA
jgi:hypothetical protein